MRILATWLLVACVVWPQAVMTGGNRKVFPSGGGGGYSVLHTYAAYQNNSTPLTVTITGTIAGDALWYYCNNNNGHDLTITGSPTKIFSGTGTYGYYQALYVQSGITGGTTSVTLTPPGYDIMSCLIWESSAVNGALDVASAISEPGYGTGSATNLTGAVTTTNASDVVLGLTQIVGTQTCTAGSGYGLVATGPTASGYTLCADFLGVAATGTYNPGMTWTSGAQSDVGTVAVKR